MNDYSHPTVCAIYLWDGALTYWRRRQMPAPWQNPYYDGGHIEYAERFSSYADVLSDFLSHEETDEHPGVFHYEVTPGLAEWIVSQPIPPSQVGFLEEIERRFEDWLSRGLTDFEVEPTRHDRESGCVDLCEPEKATAWSVYERRPRRKDGWASLAQWLADFSTKEDAEAFAKMKDAERHARGA